MYTQTIHTVLTQNGVSVSRPQAALLSRYLDTLLAVNQTMNLTAIREPDEAIVKHLLDCALCAEHVPQGADLLDVGSGGGLPAFPFAILRPDIKVTALDSTAKKVDFLSQTGKSLGLTNFRAICHRAEELANNRSYRERYTAVSARAVARLNVLAELCLPFLKVGGLFLAMKGPQGEEELSESLGGIGTLGGRPKGVSFFLLEEADEANRRTLIRIEKIRRTPPPFPRPYARIASHPL